ncbi:hypothetical protein JL722_9962 [Aureococcus anophagefferens]|nr:hypothetical protein JL722_9962 [Aureococcus anophagefferens]
MPDAVAECLFEMLLTEAVKLDFPARAPSSAPAARRRARGPSSTATRSATASWSASRRRRADHLEAIKFICKDVWNEIFGKQIDKLQTNHRGVFVLKDYTFRWLARVSSDDAEAMKRVTANILQFPCGVLRGALANLGIVATVTAEYGTLPSCSFSIRIQGNDARFDKA